MNAPVILDVDGSVNGIADATRIDLRDREEQLRFCCRQRELAMFADGLEAALPRRHGTVMLGSGDFHHLSLPLVARAAALQPLRLVVLDNHPDNMRFPFGVHCGSWVGRAARLSGVREVHVVGITSGDVGLGHAWENQLSVLRSGRVHYWCIGVPTEWTATLGIRTVRSFSDADALMAAFGGTIADSPMPTYVSIDKDVFAPSELQTNWDQGVLTLTQGVAILDRLRPHQVASDITGEVSQYRYRSGFKRLLSSIDAQPDIARAELAGMQAAQAAANQRLLAALA